MASLHPFMRLQRLAGNQAVQRLLGMQAERGTSQPTDIHVQDSFSHHSPPASGPGSRSEPLVHGRGAVQRVAGMTRDACCRSPVNPDNPVLVWTNGTKLFFAPSEAQVTTGRSVPTPEPSFAPPSGYVAEEIHWDRREGLTTGGGPVVIIARQPGQPDLEVAISNTLEQRSHFIALGVTSGAGSHVTRQGAEFVNVDDSTVPLALSGATAPDPIHQVTFPDGFLRYRAPGGDHDLYIARGGNPFAHLVERASGNISRTFAARTIKAIIPEASGVIRLERTTKALTISVPHTLTIDLRRTPPNITTGVGHTSAEPGYTAAKTRLQALGISIQEEGVRLRVAELEAIETALTVGGNRGLTALVSFRMLEGLSTSDPILEVTKSLGPDDARGVAEPGLGTPFLMIREPFEASSTERVSTVRHEMTHVVMGAIDAVNRSRLTPEQRANLEGALRAEARKAREAAQAGRLRSREYGAGDVPPPAGSVATWRQSIGEDPQLAAIWVELLKRYTFISDPEGTGEFRGVSLADESRYSKAADVSTGHPADSIGEFVASFVASATLFRNQFVADVLAAEAAGNVRGGGGGSYVRDLYRRAWSLIDGKYVSLGANPF